MVKLANFFRFSHKIFTERLTLSIAWAKNLHRYLEVPFSGHLASTIYIRHPPLTDTLQQEIITQHYAFKIRHRKHPAISSLFRGYRVSSHSSIRRQGTTETPGIGNSPN